MSDKLDTIYSVWKYRLPIAGKQVIDIPLGARILHVGFQGGVVCLWIRVNPEAEKKPHSFFITGTGQECPASTLEHVGTAVSGDFVWHVWASTSQDQHSNLTEGGGE